MTRSVDEYRSRMFSRKSASNSAAVSRAASFSDRGSLDMDRNTTTLQAVHLSTSGRRTMSLEEDDDEDDMNPWERIRATSGPMSAVSETGSKLSVEPPTAHEVRALRVTNLRRGYTVNDIQRAFEMSPSDQALSIEIQGPDSIIVHFADPDQAMKAYFAYLSSTSSIGSVTPWEPQAAKDESASSSPHRPQHLQNQQSSNRNRRSFQGNGQYGGTNNVLTALSSISAWRSSDKLSTMEKESRQSSYKSHGRSSSRSSLSSKSTEKIPSLLSMTQAHPGLSTRTSAASSRGAASSPGTDTETIDNGLHGALLATTTTTTTTTDTTLPAGTLDAHDGATSPGLQEARSVPGGKPSTARRILSGLGGLGGKRKVKG